MSQVAGRDRHVGGLKISTKGPMTNCGRCGVEQSIWWPSVLLPLTTGRIAAGQLGEVLQEKPTLTVCRDSSPRHQNTLVSARGCTCFARGAELRAGIRFEAIQRFRTAEKHES